MTRASAALADVDGLHLRSQEVTERAYQLLDPLGRWSHMVVSRMLRVFASREEVMRFATLEERLEQYKAVSTSLSLTMGPWTSLCLLSARFCQIKP